MYVAGMVQLIQEAISRSQLHTNSVTVHEAEMLFGQAYVSVVKC